LSDKVIYKLHSSATIANYGDVSRYFRTVDAM
jgi:hypothetical protein